LIEYGKAYDIGYDLTNTSNIVNDSIKYHHNLSSQVGLARYQTALELSEGAYSAFKNLSRQPMSLTGDYSSVLTKLEDSLADLITMVRDNASAQDLMVVVHHKIHPNLQGD
jgi:hypothetical protein